MIIDAYWLPGVGPGTSGGWAEHEFDGGTVRWPLLAPDDLRRVVERLAVSRAALVHTPIARIVAAIDAAAARLADDADPLRRLALDALPGLTGYSPEMVRLVLDRMGADWRAPALERLLRAELPSPACLDGFVPDSGAGARRLVHATGPNLGFHLFSGNVPGVAVTSIVRSLLVKSPTLGKTASGEPLLPALFCRALASVAPELADAVAVTYWPGGSGELEDVALDAADAVVAYGGRDMLQSIRPRLTPGTTLLDHGPRYSFGIVGREALARGAAVATAEDVATAVATFDQQGCVSPHVVYVEKGGEVAPPELAGMIAEALERLGRSLPRGRISPAEAAAAHQARGAAEFRAIAGGDVRVFAPAGQGGTDYTVVYDADPAFTPSCLNRFLWVKPVGDALDALALVAPYREYLQTVAVAGVGERLPGLALALAHAGASRLVAFADAPWPPPEWHHDGRGPLRELLRWTDLEQA